MLYLAHIRNAQLVSQQKQNMCITFVRRRPNVFDVGPTSYKYYTNVLFRPGWHIRIFSIVVELDSTDREWDTRGMQVKSTQADGLSLTGICASRSSGSRPPWIWHDPSCSARWSPDYHHKTHRSVYASQLKFLAWIVQGRGLWGVACSPLEGQVSSYNLVNPYYVSSFVRSLFHHFIDSLLHSLSCFVNLVICSLV